MNPLRETGHCRERQRSQKPETHPLDRPGEGCRVCVQHAEPKGLRRDCATGELKRVAQVFNTDEAFTLLL